ncbi:hsp70 family protein [Cerasicoccus arenae]|uniref:Molecular chaperone DnaK n=1 Tax=Cerasicoccus arenae TaxID=424488 RepID=A0A8J3DK11_9BACT|nr:hsp70 family protein [Cerasicoccus arenae]MBK1857654.1 Hsp70 family protein [Cerasicoccus arenae]GHC12862.1 molecular chaperone DnaK [Cerasicoccus arenae]
MAARYSIGIDLGTSNCALAYVDTTAASPSTQLLNVPQYEALGQWREDPVLPSFCYFLTDDEARELHPDGAVEGELAGWSHTRVVGQWAREMASLSPERVAYSAKSWLCHRGVDRESKLLPWQSTVLPVDRKLSPVDVSAAYLSYLRVVWDRQMAGKDKTARFDRQDIVITVPASFDADAQRLTLEAAERAGYPASTRLLEEPQAAFYAWLERHPGASELATAFPQLNERPELVLVCDIGGGTSDFSLFEVTASEGDEHPSIRRLAVSEHILLGGDNLDLALAKMVEPQLADGGTLSTSAWAQLLSQCRTLKEWVLADPAPDPAKLLRVSVTDGGSSLFASARSAEVSQGELLTLMLDGFFPECPVDARPAQERTGLRELGLPYAQDSAITRHLAGFLRGRRVDALLFNGGTVASSLLRERLCAQAAVWQDNAEPGMLANDEPHLAVARGAAFYRFSERQAAGLTITGGSGHAIYLEIQGAAPKKRRGKTKRKDAPVRSGVCILPQGAEIEAPVRLVEPEIQLMVDRPVRFQAWTSPSRPEDTVGEVVDLDDDAFHRLPALTTLALLPPNVEKPEGGKLAVHLIAELNNLGLLQLVCESVRRVGDRQRRWSLEFNLREKLNGDEPIEETPAEDTGAATEDLQAAQAQIGQCFGLQSNSEPQSEPARLIKQLEDVLRLKRKDWNTALLRELWEPLGESITRRDRSTEHELAWLMAAGFCLRPGYGHPLDRYRMQRLWFLHELGLAHDRDKAIREQLFILWRRTAGGLDRDQQAALYHTWRERIYDDAKQAYEPLRMAGALEWLPSEDRMELANHCLKLILERADKYCDHAIWALGRLLTRTPLYAGEGAILPVSAVTQAFDQLARLSWRDSLAGLKTTFTQAARRLDNRDHDLDEALRGRIVAKLTESGAKEDQLRRVTTFVPIEEKDRQQLFGESLPVGLHW